MDLFDGENVQLIKSKREARKRSAASKLYSFLLRLRS